LKVIIAGSRTLNNPSVVDNVITQAFNKWMANDPENWRKYYRPEIVSGGAQGVDFCGEMLAKRSGLPLTVFPANWNEHGRSAGIIRNKEMAKYADALIAVWDGESRGTANMIDEMTKLNKLIYVHTIKKAP
jgi:hypothetical protein